MIYIYHEGEGFCSLNMLAVPLCLIIISGGGSITKVLDNRELIVQISENPDVEIQIDTLITKAKASIVEKPDSRYQELWEKATDTYHGFDNYQKATSRSIPIVIIKPC